MVAPMEAARPERVRLLGADVDLITPTELLGRVEGYVAAGGTAVVANHNAHSLALCRRAPRLRAFFEQADLIEIDSVPMIAWGRVLGLPVSRDHRCTYLDWRADFWTMASDRGWRVFFLGGAPGVAERACARLSETWPQAQLASHHGYFDPTPGSTANAQVLAQIAAFDPDIILVGMGMPLQEEWILANRTALTRGVLLSVGGAFDYEAGVQIAAPRWMGRLGLEWLFRLASQPRRLAHRYLVEPWDLAPLALDDLRRVMGKRDARSLQPRVA
jgi:N-acetylglucosaminyldiphosphoundecaprenol N-acetyl-beta-D-mannosaminyltransferase